VSNNIMELLQGIIGELKVIAKSETVVGQPVTAGDRTIIPVTRISVGFGAGGGEEGKQDKGSRFGGGGGGGAVIDPVAFLVIEKDKVFLLAAKKKGSFDKIIESAPDVLAAIKNLATRKSPGADEEKS
jgi:sporulation protein YtfJ